MRLTIWLPLILACWITRHIRYRTMSYQTDKHIRPKWGLLTPCKITF
jgi:hypothetical protein